MCFSPDQLGIYLKQPASVLRPNLDILEREGLAARWEEYEDDWRNLPISGPRYYLGGLDIEDIGVFLLCQIHQRFQNAPCVILDIFENLNFQLLDS